LNDLAFIYADKGKINEAILLYEKALKIFESIEDIQGQAATLYCLASIHADAGEIDYAILLYEKSLKIFESIRDDQQQAFALVSLGYLLAYKKGDFVTALDYLHQSLKIFQGIQSPNAETVREIINDVQKMANG
jgi:tetratricopeptide (TPR) repeat protein